MKLTVKFEDGSEKRDVGLISNWQESKFCLEYTDGTEQSIFWDQLPREFKNEILPEQAEDMLRSKEAAKAAIRRAERNAERERVVRNAKKLAERNNTAKGKVNLSVLDMQIAVEKFLATKPPAPPKSDLKLPIATSAASAKKKPKATEKTKAVADSKSKGKKGQGEKVKVAERKSSFTNIPPAGALSKSGNDGSKDDVVTKRVGGSSGSKEKGDVTPVSSNKNPAEWTHTSPTNGDPVAWLMGEAEKDSATGTPKPKRIKRDAESDKKATIESQSNDIAKAGAKVENASSSTASKKEDGGGSQPRARDFLDKECPKLMSELARRMKGDDDIGLG